MTALIRALTRQEQLNFLLTNRIPRITLTRFIGWYSVIENRALTRFSIAVWRLFGGDLNLDESRQREFRSLRDCFIRELKPGVRSIDPDPAIITSPCDAIVGACGPVEGTRVYQAKGFPYQLEDLIPDPALVEKIRNGVFVTLRLKSNMYHRFHAPRDCRVSEVVYQSGDTWNVNPVALKRIEGLFCKNERAVIELETGQAGLHLVMVPVAEPVTLRRDLQQGRRDGLFPAGVHDLVVCLARVRITRPGPVGATDPYGRSAVARNPGAGSESVRRRR